jgi:hypothetical protein
VRGSTAYFVGALIALVLALAPRTARAEDTELRDRVIIACVLPPVAALVGGGFLIAGKLYGDSAQTEADELGAKHYRDPCASEPDTCKAIDHDLEAVDDALIGTVASFATAGVAAVVGVALVIDSVVKKPKKSSTSSVRVLPLAGPQGGGLIMGLSF